MVCPSSVVVYGEQGDALAVPLPCKAARAWPLLEGLLVERHLPPPDEPSLFSLLHPLEELKPVAFVPVDRAAAMGGGPDAHDAPRMAQRQLMMDTSLELAPGAVHWRDAQYLRDAAERVLFASRVDPVLLTHSVRTGRHRLWVIRQSSAEIDRRMRADLPLEQRAAAAASAPPASALDASFAATPLDTSRRSSIARPPVAEPASLPSLPPPATPFSLDRTAELDEDRAITSELVLQESWLSASPSVAASAVFCASSADRVPLLCLFFADAGELVGLELRGAHSSSGEHSLRVRPAFTLGDVAAAVPVRRSSGAGAAAEAADGYECDIVVLSRATGQLTLHRGAERLWSLPLRFLGGAAPSPLPAVADLLHAGDRRLTLVFGDRSRARAVLPAASQSPLVCGALDALLAVLPPALSRTVVAEHAAFALRRAEGDAWTTFLAFVLSRLEAVRPRRAASSRGTERAEDAWSLLLRSGYHASHLCATAALGLSRSAEPLPLNDTSTSVADAAVDVAAWREALPLLLAALHLWYEEQKLSALTQGNLRPMAVLLVRLAAALARPDYVEHYQRDFGDLDVPAAGATPAAVGAGDPRLLALEWHGGPPDVLQWLLQCARGLRPDPFPAVPFCPLSALVCRFYTLLFVARPGADRALAAAAPAAQLLSPFTPAGARPGRAAGADEAFPLFSPAALRARPVAYAASAAAEHLVLALVAAGVGPAQLDELPMGVALPLRDALTTCRTAPPSGWPLAAYLLVGRADIARLEQQAARGGGAERVAAQGEAFADMTAVELDAGAATDGTAMVLVQAALRFGRDLRCQEVRRLLRSNRSVCVRVPLQHELAGREVTQEQQARLFLLSRRILALSVGRGAFTLASLTPVLTDVLPVPPLLVQGRVPQRSGAHFELDLVSAALLPPALADSFRHWPEFHNGVAAGLRISPEQSRITRTWIVYNRPEQLNHAHAGVLFALGLQGFLGALAPADFFWYLSPKHDATTVAILLGMATAKRCSMDTVRRLRALRV